MNRILLIICFLFGLQLYAFAQDDENLVFDSNAEPIKVSGFSSVDFSNIREPLFIFVSQGNIPGLATSVYGDNTSDAELNAWVDDGTLHFRVKSKNGGIKKDNSDLICKVYLTASDLNHIILSSRSNLKFLDPVRFQNLDLTVNGESYASGKLDVKSLILTVKGASSAKLKLNVRNLNLIVDAASNVTLDGTADTLNLTMRGAAQLKAYGLLVSYCNAILQGVSEAQIFVEKKFPFAQLTGVSTLKYKGHAVLEESSVSGVSSIKHEN